MPPRPSSPHTAPPTSARLRRRRLLPTARSLLVNAHLWRRHALKRRYRHWQHGALHLQHSLVPHCLQPDHSPTRPHHSLLSVFTKSYFGGTAMTTIDSAGNLIVAGTASTTLFSSYGPAWFGATATSSFSSIGALSRRQRPHRRHHSARRHRRQCRHRHLGYPSRVALTFGDLDNGDGKPAQSLRDCFFDRRHVDLDPLLHFQRRPHDGGRPLGHEDANLQFAADTNAWDMGYASTTKAFVIASSTNLSSNVAFTILKNNLFVGIGTTSPGYLLTVGNSGVSGVVAGFENGTGECTINPASSSVNCSSDITLKKNINSIKLIKVRSPHPFPQSGVLSTGIAMRQVHNIRASSPSRCSRSSLSSSRKLTTARSSSTMRASRRIYGFLQALDLQVAPVTLATTSPTVLVTAQLIRLDHDAVGSFNVECIANAAQ